MQTKSKLFRNDWFVQFEKTGFWYVVQVRAASGELHDKVRCDDYRNACDYYRAFCAIAKNGVAA